MTAKELISPLIPPLKLSDTGDKALVWMHEFSVGYLPVVNKGKFIGLLSEEDVMDLEDPSEPIRNYDLKLPKPSVNEHVHIYEVVKLAAEVKLVLIPVVDKEENYLGVITQESIISNFAKLSSITENGSIIVLELNKNDYSLAEIARIVEETHASVLSSYISTHKDSMKIEVTVKVNTTDIKQIVASFERYNYTVAGSFQETEYYEDLKDRFNALMSYLNI
ncbi:MAG TPA: CBS domain-containing protein [Chitinophagales bacterium]|nr:CBS domain-containing protein [Chitinophagales bacterium]